MSAPYGIDDLPRFSPWPARLLGLLPWAPRKKTAAEIMREFDGDKWGPLLQRLRADANATVDTVDDWFAADVPESLASVGEHFERISAREGRQRHLQLVASTLAEYTGTRPSALVELGAGYGSVLLALARQPPFAGLGLVAGEFAPSGAEMLKWLGRAQAAEIEVAACDLASTEVTPLRPPPDAIVFTSFATMYVRELRPALIATLRAWQPRVVVHFEPCYEHFDSRSLLGLMRRRYVDVNDYNVNLVSLLHEQQAAGRIRIVEERPNVFGANPLLPASVMAWTPTGDS